MREGDGQRREEQNASLRLQTEGEKNQNSLLTVQNGDLFGNVIGKVSGKSNVCGGTERTGHSETRMERELKRTDSPISLPGKRGAP